MLKRGFLFLVFSFVGISAFAIVNTWQGDESLSWSTAGNWSLNSVPTADHDVVIPSGTPDYCYASSGSGYNAYCNSLEIQSGATLRIGYATITIDLDLNIYGTLRITYVDGVLDVNGDVIWHAGSSKTGDFGVFRVYDHWTFEDGTNCALGTNTTVEFDAIGTSYIYCYDADATFGNVELDKPAGSNTYLSLASTHPMRVTGYMTINADNDFHVTSADLVVDGTLDILSGGELHLDHAGGTLTNNSDLDLWQGEISINGGEATINGRFDQHSGILSISSGSLVIDDVSGATLTGELNLSGSGILRVYSSIAILLSADINITGGTIEVEDNFDVLMSAPNMFQPTAGTIKFFGDGNSTLRVDKSDGNFVYDLIIQKSPTANGVRFTGDTEIKHDVIINSGILQYIEDYTTSDLEVGGDWTNNVGSSGFLEGYSRIVFDGTGQTQITTDETFYDLEIDKLNSSYNAVDLAAGITINVLGDLDITDGCIEMNSNSTIDVEYDLSISANAGINASGDNDLKIYVGRHWDNANTSYSTNYGFSPGTYSTVEFDGTSLQQISSSATYEDFYNLIVDVSGTNLNLLTSIRVLDDLEVLDGTLELNGHTLEVQNDVDVHGNLSMITGTDELIVGNNITFHSGSLSSGVISTGTINVFNDWIFENGTDAQLGVGNTVNFLGGGAQRIYNYDADASFGNVTVDKPDINPVWLDNSSTEDIDVTGDLTITGNSRLQVQSTTLIVDGSLDIEYGSRMYLVQTGGELINNSDFGLHGQLDIDGGDVLIHGEFDLETTGTLTIDGGSFIYDEGFSAVPLNIRGTFIMSDGLYQASEYFGVSSTATTNISGGLIRVSQLRAETAGTFQPVDGTVEIQTDNGTAGSIICINGNYFHDLSINPLAGGGSILYNNITIQNNLEITTGELWFNSYEATVNNNINIYGGLTMDDSSDILSVGNDIIWYSGSDDYSTDGTINVSGDWYFNDGTDAQLGTGNTVNFMGPGSSDIYCNDADASFGNITVDKPDINPLRLDNSSTEDIDVTGDLTITGNSRLQVQSTTLIVEGTLDIEDGSRMYLEHTGGELINNSDFTLNGEMDIDGGDVLINGSFYQSTTGVLTIDSGSFISDTVQGDHLAMGGTLNMSDGLLESRNSGIYILSTLNDNITGGTIRVGSLFDAAFTNTFQPSGGMVEMNYIDTGTSSICCYESEGNYFNDLNIVDGSYQFFTNVTIQNNLDVSQYAELGTYDGEVTVNNNMNIYGSFQIGYLQILNITNDITWYTGSTSFTYGGTINVSGDWYFNNGTDAQLGTGNTVNFVGSDNSYIYFDDVNACFGNLTVDKDSSIDMVEVISGNTIRTAGNLNVTEGMLKIHDQSTLEIGNEFNIYSSFYTQGTSSNDAVITKYGTGFFDFNVETGGMIGGSYTTFENVGSAGVNIKAGAFLDALYSLNNCTFRNGETGGSLLTIDNSQTVTIDGAEFYAGSRDAVYNVTKTVDAGEITFTNSSGLFDGPDYEDDIHDRIHWSGFTVPTVTTAAITNIEQTTATSGGNVTLDGNSLVIARGVCWSISNDPSIADDHTSDGSGTGTFVSSLTSLDPDTHYYVRAYATNALGTSYGSEQEFDTLTDVPPDPPINLTIDISETDVVLNWEAVPGAVFYIVYSSDDPNTAFGSWTMEQVDVTGTTWDEPIPVEKKFYYVSAVN